MVVHLAGFDLGKYRRETVTAVLEVEFGLAPSTIINVSPIAPELQELHIIASRFPDLVAAVAKTNDALRISSILDARKSLFVATEVEYVIAEAKARFDKRLDLDIARLSVCKSSRLRDLAEFLILYKNEGVRKSAPRKLHSF